MAMNKTVAKAALISLYNDASTGEGVAAEDFADEMLDIFIALVSSGTVNTTLTPLSATATDPISGALPVIGGSSTGSLT
jgi:hypothetical protein